jgi:hypothetical protein
MLRQKSHVFLLFIAIQVVLLGVMFLHASIRREMDRTLLEQKRDAVGHLALTDICLFTDARYARHPSMADFATPFQDSPLSLDHFPSGSFMNVPPHLNPSYKEFKEP